MKDEEIAEEYLNQSCCEFIQECKEGIRCRCSDFEMKKQIFLAGLKAQPKWHILAEEPDVLPKEGQKVKVLTEEGKIEESTYFYDTYYEEFAFSNIGFLKVFAWCELSTFNKE